MRAGRLLLVLFFGLSFLHFSCLEPATDDEVEIEIKPDDAQVIMPPAGEFEIRNDTAVITGHDTAPLIHSFPQYAGVPLAGEIGLGSAMGFNAGQRVTIPCNVNLGNKRLASYEIGITIEKPGVIHLATIEGSNSSLSTYYSDQYKRAAGFEPFPQTLAGQTPGVYTISTLPVKETATGRINLFNLLVDLNKATPAGGTWIYIDVLEFKDENGSDICPVAGCTLFDSIFIKEFRLN